MSEPLHVACIQLAASEGEARDERVMRARDLVVEAASVGARLVVLPELWSTGYFSFDRYSADAETLDGALVRRLRRWATDLRIHLMGGSFVERTSAGLANCAVTIAPDGDVVLTYRKIHLFGHESEEARLLTAGERVEVASTSIGRLGTSTCYDLRFPELYRLLVDGGAEIVIVPAAWPAARVAHWRLLVQARAIENQIYVVACNGAGEQGEVTLAGHSMVVDPWGETVAEAGEHETVLHTELNPSRVAEVRRAFPVLRHRRLGIPSPLAGDSAER